MLFRSGGLRAWPAITAIPISIGAFAAVCLHAWQLDGLARLAAAVALLGLAPSLAALLRGDGARAIAELGRWLIAACWIGALPACWIALRAHVPWWMLVGAVLTVKCNDMGAYFAGVALGRHRMAPWISPKKSWEGFVGGTLASLAAGAWLGHASGAGLARGLAFGVAASVLGPKIGRAHV